MIFLKIWYNILGDDKMEHISNNQILKTEFGFQFEHNLDDKKYVIQIVYPQNTDNYSIPYILVIPKQIKEGSMLAVEVNNYESEEKNNLINKALVTARDLTEKLKDNDNPVLVPVIPSVNGGIPYYQQLSKECFNLSTDSPLYRIDLQVLNIIKAGKERISKYANVSEKIFLNGYSSSGVFAQRFSLLHPEIVDTLCVGGASGSIPMPTTELQYPLGIADYYDITGKHFDYEAYSQIKFRYYVGSLEDTRKSSNRYDENGNFAPMHDMSYFDRSIPPVIGAQQRKLFGTNIIERSTKQIQLMKTMGLDIEQVIFENRTHNNFNGIGVNELGDEFVKYTYQQSKTSEKKL